MDYLKRKKETACLILFEAHVNGFYTHKFNGGRPDTRVQLNGLEGEINKLIDQVYKRGLKDGAKKV